MDNWRNYEIWDTKCPKSGARRNGYDLDGRTYRLRAIAEDEAGNSSEAMTDILVPHNL